ncbi:MAG: NUDIX hydrolase [Bacteroidota bacterium]
MQPIEDSLKFKSWYAAVEKNGNAIHNVRDLHTVRKRNGTVLFSMVHMQADSPEGNPLLPVVLIRGHFVSIVTVLRDAETGEEFFLLVRQRRVANGALFYEHPAGMVDEHTDPFEIALIELYEETGLKVQRDQLRLLNDELYYSSPGLLDEGGYFFACEIELPRAEIMAYHEAAHGEGGEGEFIHTYVATPAAARRLIKNSNGLLGMFLYREKGSDF